MEQLTKGQRFRARKENEEPWYYHATKLKRRTLEVGGDITFEDALNLCKEVWLRDEGKCQYDDDSCKGHLGMHHLDGNRLNNVPSNLKMTCNRHHRMQHEPAHLGHKHSEESKKLMSEKRKGTTPQTENYRRTHPLTDPQVITRLEEMMAKGWTKTKICSELGIARQTLNRWLKRTDRAYISPQYRGRSSWPKRGESGRWRK